MGRLVFHGLQTSCVAHLASCLVGIVGYQGVILPPNVFITPLSPGTVALRRTKSDPHILTSCAIRDIEHRFLRLYDQRYQTVVPQILTSSVITDIKRLYSRSLHAL